MGSLSPVRVQRRAATNWLARCNAAAAMACKQAVRLCDDALDKNRPRRELEYSRVSQRPPASLGIGSRAVRCGPSTPGHSHLDHPASACRNAAIRAIGGARDGSPQLSYTRIARHGSLPSLVSAEAAPASYEAIGRTQLLSSLRNCAPSPRPLTNNHGPCGHVQRRARW